MDKYEKKILKYFLNKGVGTVVEAKTLQKELGIPLEKFGDVVGACLSRRYLWHSQNAKGSEFDQYGLEELGLRTIDKELKSSKNGIFGIIVGLCTIAGVILLFVTTFGLSENETIPEIQQKYEPPNPSMVINEELGFQITLPDPEDYAALPMESWNNARFAFVDWDDSHEVFPPELLPNVHEKMIKIRSLNPEMSSYTLEILVFEPNENDTDENFKRLIKILNILDITNIQTELESDVNGLWYQVGYCTKWFKSTCQHYGWIQLYKSSDVLYMVHMFSESNQDQSGSFEIPEEFKFIIESFRPF